MIAVDPDDQDHLDLAVDGAEPVRVQVLNALPRALSVPAAIASGNFVGAMVVRRLTGA